MTEKRVATELGTERLGKLLARYAIPAIVAMIASSLYNIVDSIFIGQGVGAMAISGLAITFPLMNLAAAFGSLIGAGASTLISVRLGQKDYLSAQRVLGNVVTLNLILGISFGVVALIFLDPVLYFFGASDATIPYARDYMTIIMLGNVVTHMYLGLNNTLRSSGHPQQAMYATIAAVVINTLLDYTFIYIFHWGIQGAAWATVIAQFLALLWIIKLFTDKREMLHFHRGIYGLKRRIVKDTLAIGASPFLMNLCACLIVILINKGLQTYGGDLAIGAFGIVNRVSFIFIMIVIGLNQGMQPIAGFNFGAKQFDRMKRVVYMTIAGATCITTSGFLIGEFFPNIIARCFTTDAELIARSVEGMRIVFVCFPIIGFQMVTSHFFQSVGLANKAIFLSLTRQLLFLVPCLIFLPPLLERTMGSGAIGVWMSMPTSDLLATIVTVIMFRHQMKQRFA